MNDFEWIEFYRNRPVADHELASSVLGLETDELSQMVHRDNISCVAKNPGRGKSREYTFAHILHAAIVCEMRKYGMRLSRMNVQAAQTITDWVFRVHATKNGKVDQSLVGKVVYFVVAFDASGAMQPLKPQAGDTIRLAGIGKSGVVIVITSILADLIYYLKPNAELLQQQSDKAKMIDAFASKIQPRRK